MYFKPFLASIGFLFFNTLYANNDCQLYPSWPNCMASEPLMQIEKIIAAHRHNKNQLAVAFDWDGTLYNEKIIPNNNIDKTTYSGQSLWRQWAANQIENKHITLLFPAFKPANKTNYTAWANQLRNADNKVEGRLKNSSKLSDDQKFKAIAGLSKGMKVKDYIYFVNEYLNDYSVKNAVYRQPLEIFQRLQDQGFTPWIITGSNPYFVATVLYRINTDLNYHLMPHCSNYIQKILKNKTVSNQKVFRNVCHIAGNTNTINDSEAFTDQYDSRFVNHTQNQIVDGPGKWLAAQYIATHNHPIAIYAGNSNGDAVMIEKLLSTPHAFKDPAALFVYPGGKKLLRLLKTVCRSQACILIRSD